jgi:hypothetical protein
VRNGNGRSLQNRCNPCTRRNGLIITQVYSHRRLIAESHRTFRILNAMSVVTAAKCVSYAAERIGQRGNKTQINPGSTPANREDTSIHRASRAG